MRMRRLFFNGKIYTQVAGLPPAESMAIDGNFITAVGKNLKYDADFSSYEKINLNGNTVIPGLVDAHTHFYFIIISMGTVKLDGLNSLEQVLDRIRKHSAKLEKDEWVVGEGFSPDRWKKFVVPDRLMLDKVTGGRPAAIFSKDQHMLWTNSKALALAGISTGTPQPAGGAIERFSDGSPSGILKEIPGYFPVFKLIGKPGRSKIARFHQMTLKEAYSRGVTGVHSFDGPDALPYFRDLSAEKKLGLRVNFYPPAKMIEELARQGIGRKYGNDYFRVTGVKIFADGSLGSQSALCFQKYIESKNNFGIETTPKSEIAELIEKASKLNLPAAIHAIGDKAISNVLDCFEHAPALPHGIRHRIEHLQMIRRSDIARVKRLGVVASMQPTHCPSDVRLIEKYWGKRGRNCYIFRTLIDRGVHLAFGSDAPIETLHPVAGIDAAVNRFIPGTRKSFYPQERISVAEAIFNFTAGPAYAVGQENERGYLLPGYKADFVVFEENPYKISRFELSGLQPAATFLDGVPVYIQGKLARLL